MADVNQDTDPSPYLETIRYWQKRAQEVADQESRWQTKIAVQKVKPHPKEAQAIYKLFAINARTIYFVCRDAWESYTYSEHRDEPHMTLEDLLSEAYILWQRSLVRYDGDGDRSLTRLVRGGLRDRVRDFLETKLSIPDDPESRREIGDTAPAAPTFRMADLYQDLVDNGVVSEIARKLWNDLNPEGN